MTRAFGVVENKLLVGLDYNDGASTVNRVMAPVRIWTYSTLTTRFRSDAPPDL